MITRRSMLASLCKGAAFSVVAIGYTATSFGADTQHANGQQEEREIVSFRLETWKSLHIHNNGEAERLVELLKNIGCEAELRPHGNHVDVHYRCVEWKSIALTNDADADRWETWLKEKGFDAIHR